MKPVIWISIVVAALAVAVLSIVAMKLGHDRALAGAGMDVRFAATWDATDGGAGVVTPLVIDECQRLPQLAGCPAAIRGVIRFYLDLGGEYGCTQAVRALSLYRDLGDDLSRSVAAKCAKEQK